jgi:hypothetical protein
MGKGLDDYLSRVGSSKTKDRKGDGLGMSKEDEKLLNTAWDRIRKRLLAKKSLKKKPAGRR